MRAGNHVGREAHEDAQRGHGGVEEHHRDELVHRHRLPHELRAEWAGGGAGGGRGGVEGRSNRERQGGATEGRYAVRRIGGEGEKGRGCREGRMRGREQAA